LQTAEHSAVQDLQRTVKFYELAEVERHIVRMQRLVARQEQLIVSRELGGHGCPAVLWEIRATYSSMLTMYETLGERLRRSVVGASAAHGYRFAPVGS
jgi:hypothetical protein